MPHPNLRPFGPDNPAPRRIPKSERYYEQIRRADDLGAGKLNEMMLAAIDIAEGNAVEHLINHKTGQVHEIPVNPATRLKAVQFVVERVAGKPEAQKTLELGDGMAGAFKVLLGAAAADHWALPEPAPAIEAGFVASSAAPVEE